MKMSGQRGFTLLELLLALAIFALVAAMAYSALNNVLLQADVVDERAAKLKALQNLMLMLEEDMSQAVNRPVRDDFGDSEPAFDVAEYGRYQLELTRAGYANPLRQERSDLVRVGYGVDDEGHLNRIVWPMLDRVPGSEPYSVALLDGVKKLSIRVLDYSNEWHDFWPLAGQPVTDWPRAVELTVESESSGDLRRLFALVNR